MSFIGSVRDIWNWMKLQLTFQPLTREDLEIFNRWVLIDNMCDHVIYVIVRNPSQFTPELNESLDEACVNFDLGKQHLSQIMSNVTSLPTYLYLQKYLTCVLSKIFWAKRLFHLKSQTNQNPNKKHRITKLHLTIIDVILSIRNKKLKYYRKKLQSL